MYSKLSVNFGSKSELSEWVNSVDDELLKMTYISMECCKKLLKENAGHSFSPFSINDRNGFFMLIDALEKTGGFKKEKLNEKEYRLKRNGKYSFSNPNGSADKNKINNLRNWCLSNVSSFDVGIRNNSAIFNEDTLNKIVSFASETGARVNSFGALFNRNQGKEKTVSESIMIRFPDKENPYLIIYFSNIFAWYKCNRTLFIEKNNYGVNMELKSIKFRPNNKKLSEINAYQVSRMKSEMEGLDFINF